MSGFKERMRQVDVLILDDVHFLAGRERTQEEFFHTFNGLHAQRHQIVLTSDKAPRGELSSTAWIRQCRWMDCGQAPDGLDLTLFGKQWDQVSSALRGSPAVKPS
jgi:hypothetical protein